MEIEMVVNKSRSAYIALTIVAAIFMSACGLKGDLYIPSEETQGEATKTQTAEIQNKEEAIVEETNPDDENNLEAAGALPESTP
jgi:predicted small lipoprotein YifL